MKLLVLFTFILVSAWSVSQTPFYKQYSNNGYDFGQGIVELPDSSYVITGASSSFTEGPSQMFLLKVDSLGAYEWSRHYGGSETDWGRRVKHIDGVGFFVGGFTNSSGNGAYDFALWKIDENGDEEWFKTYGTSGWERVHDMAITADSGVILVGETNLSTDGYTDIYIVRTDFDGNILWENQIENPGNDNAMAIEQFDDSTFIIAGYYHNSTTNLRQAWLTRIQDDGTEIWTQIWGDDYDFTIEDIALYDDVVFGAGGKTMDATDESYIFMPKIDGLDGTIIGSESTSMSPEYGLGITPHNEPDLFNIATLYMGDFAYGEEGDLFFIGFTHHPYYYATLAEVKYVTPQILGEVITTYNYGSIAVGYNQNVGPGGASVFIVRIGRYQPAYEVYDIFTADPLVSIEQIMDDKDGFTIYPNPSSEKIFIRSEDYSSENFVIQLFDLFGKEIIRIATNTIDTTEIDVSAIESGVYTLVIRCDNGTQTMRKVTIK